LAVSHPGGVACHRGGQGPSKPTLIVDGGETENVVADIKAATAGNPPSSSRQETPVPTKPDEPFDRLRCVPPTTTRPCA
jgi:hypothetical protein